MDIEYLKNVFHGEEQECAIENLINDIQSLKEKDNFEDILYYILSSILSLKEEKLKLSSLALLFLRLPESILFLISKFNKEEVQKIFLKFPHFTFQNLLEIFPNENQKLSIFFLKIDELEEISTNLFPSAEEAIKEIFNKLYQRLLNQKYKKIISRKFKDEKFTLLCDYATSSFSQREIILDRKILSKDISEIEKNYFNLYGPINSIWTEKEKNGYEYRMKKFGEKWFSKSCDKCSKNLSYETVVRKPVVGGGWDGCYCSWNCVKNLYLSDEEDYLLRLILTRN